jgi:hypothetical protein
MQHPMKNHTRDWLIIFVSLLLGLIIYVGTRTDRLFLNQFLDLFGVHSIKIFLANFLPYSRIPLWIIYSLPDALWMLALTMSVMLIWNFQLNRRSIPWIMGAIAVGFMLEMGQGLHMITGTFDVIDLLFIFMGASIPIVFTLLKFRLWKTK